MMAKLSGKISISRWTSNREPSEGIAIRIQDNKSGIVFCEVQMNPRDFARAVTGLGGVKCSFEVRQGDIGKKREQKSVTFELPNGLKYEERKEAAKKAALEACPIGWTASNYFGSHDSFFTKDGKSYARTTIYRYIEEGA